MAKEKQPQFLKNKYDQNKRKAFRAYGIKISDPEYNCHHIVTKNDLITGLFPDDFDINGLSNLYPIRIKEHELLNEIIYAVDNNYDITPYLNLWREIEDQSFKKTKIVSKKSVDIKATIPTQTKLVLNEKNKKNKKKKEKRHRGLILEKIKKQEIQEYLSDYYSSFRTNLAEI